MLSDVFRVCNRPELYVAARKLILVVAVSHIKILRLTNLHVGVVHPGTDVDVAFVL